MRTAGIILNFFFGLTWPVYIFFAGFLGDDPTNPKAFGKGLALLIGLHSVAVLGSIALAWKQRGADHLRAAFWVSWIPAVTLLATVAFVWWWSASTTQRHEERDRAFLNAPSTFSDPSQQYYVSVSPAKNNEGYQVFCESRLQGERRSVSIGRINERSEFVFDSKLAGLGTSPLHDRGAARDFLRSCKNSAGVGFLDRYKWAD